MMNNELSAESDLNNLITVNFTETMTPEIELTETELEAMDDIRFSDELTAMVAELPVFTDEQNIRYNDKMTMLADIRNEIPSLNVNVVEETDDQSYVVPAGRYDYVYSMGTI
jgi:chemotaxis response regulator CheB